MLQYDDFIAPTAVLVYETFNPGALYRARQKTVATLDTAKDMLTFLEVFQRDR